MNIITDKQVVKAIKSHIETLRSFQEKLFNQGHTFWHCDAEDEAHNKPFYYFQINKTRDMSTCSTCYQLIENRKKIRNLQKMIGEQQDPLYTNFTSEAHIKKISVNRNSGVNFDYLYR